MQTIETRRPTPAKKIGSVTASARASPAFCPPVKMLITWAESAVSAIAIVATIAATRDS